MIGLSSGAERGPAHEAEEATVFSIFGKKAASQAGEQPPEQGRFVRPMQARDIPAVLAIIEEHDEDDADEAQESFAQSINHVFVAVDDGVVVGVTGAAFDNEAEQACWLSWTYVKEGHRRQGIGRYLVDGLLHELSAGGVKKVFISTGDYIEDGEDIYAAAKGFYQALGARLELQIDDYYEPGEAGYFFGLELEDLNTVPDAPPAGYLTFDSIAPVGDAERAAHLTWREFNEADASQDPAGRLASLIAEAKREGARYLIAAFPSDLREGAEQGLAAAGFNKAGELRHYYRPGLHQVYWLCRF